MLKAASDALGDAIACFESAAVNQALDESRRVIRERINWYRNTQAGVLAQINAIRQNDR